MNKIKLISGKGIEESFTNICASDNSVEIEFELENMPMNNKNEIISICTYLNRIANDGKLFYNEWVLISHYPEAILVKGHDKSGNSKYIKIIKRGE